MLDVEKNLTEASKHIDELKNNWNVIRVEVITEGFILVNVKKDFGNSEYYKLVIKSKMTDNWSILSPILITRDFAILSGFGYLYDGVNSQFGNFAKKMLDM